MLTVITQGEHGTRFTEDRAQGIIVLKSDKGSGGNFAMSIDELTSMDAHTKAIGFACTQGVGDARINGSPGHPYPVNADGIPLERVRDENGNPYPLTHPKMKVDHYRTDIPVTRRLV